MASPGLVARAADRWGLAAGGATRLPGAPNVNVLLPESNAVLRFFRAEAGPARVAGLHQARAALRAAGIPTADLLTSRSGRTWEVVDGLTVEAEARVGHDARMNTPGLLTTGAAMLASVHNAWEHLRLEPEAESCSWANWIAPQEVSAGVRAGIDRVGRGTRVARDVGDAAWRLSSLVDTEPETLRRQLVHGDFWDDNVYFRGQTLVAVTDFDFLARRPRVDDLALLLYFADEQPFFEGVPERDDEARIDALRPLVDAYVRGLSTPLSDVEQHALPVALARQPLWSLGKWIPLMESGDQASTEMTMLAGPVRRALAVAEDQDRWRAGLFE